MNRVFATIARRGRLGTVCVLATLSGIAGCGSKTTLPIEPGLPPPPQVVATVPAARSTSVPYDSEIYVDFSQDMSSSGMGADNVFLKIDTQRIPIDLAWENGFRRLRILPQVQLALRRTFTVELTTLTSSAGGAAGWFYQFTTNSVRRPTTPRPVEGTKDESPFVLVTWDSTEVSAGSIRYELWAGPDSNLVVNRMGTPVVTTTRGRWLPTTPWPLGNRVFWAISVINNTTGEVLPGPTHRFDVLAAATPQDSLEIPATDSAYDQILTGDPINPYQTCGGDSVLCGLGLGCWISFSLAALPADVKVASVVIEMSTWNHYVNRLNTVPISLMSSTQGWPHPCRNGVNFLDQLPIVDQLLATHVTTGTRVFRFQTPLLASHVEASVRRGTFYGYSLVATQRFAVGSSHVQDPTYRPVLKIHYFRTSPAPLAAVAP